MDREIINAKQVWFCSSHQNIVPSPAGWLEQSSIFLSDRIDLFYFFIFLKLEKKKTILLELYADG